MRNLIQLHDKTRRRICIALFILLCAAPTCATIGWCAWRLLPWSSTAQARAIGDSLGAQVHWSSLRHPRPGVEWYEDFELADPEKGETALRCQCVEATTADVSDPQKGSKRALVVKLSHAEIEVARLPILRQLVERIMRSQSARLDADVQITASELTLKAGKNSQTLVDFTANFSRLQGGVQVKADASFRVAGASEGTPASFSVTRDRRQSPPLEWFEFKSGSAPLPCSLLASAISEFAAFGEQATFQGDFWAKETPTWPTTSRWEGEFHGRIDGVDLDRLVSEQFPHKLSGTATVGVKSAQFLDGRIVKAEGGFLKAGPGVVGRSLLTAAVRIGGCQSKIDFDSIEDATPYQDLALSFQLNDARLEVHGHCVSANSQVLILGRNGPLLFEPRNQPQSPLALVSVLSPEGLPQAPVAPQTEWLLSRLPIPAESAAATEKEERPQAKALGVRQGLQ